MIGAYGLSMTPSLTQQYLSTGPSAPSAGIGGGSWMAIVGSAMDLTGSIVTSATGLTASKKQLEAVRIQSAAGLELETARMASEQRALLSALGIEKERTAQTMMAAQGAQAAALAGQANYVPLVVGAIGVTTIVAIAYAYVKKK